jgi:hypothetical protein
MKIKIIILFLFYFSCSAQDLSYVGVFGSKVYFEPPDTSIWKLYQNSMTDYGNHLLMFKHIPIKDSLGREIEPVISFIVESVTDSSDVINYSIWKRTQVPFEVKKVMSCDTINFSWFACPNVIGYEGVYSKVDIIHRVFVVHMRRASVGVQIICDSTDGVYVKVESAMRNFIRSIGIDQ